MEQITTLLPITIEPDWDAWVAHGLRIGLILLGGGIAYAALRVIRQRVAEMTVEGEIAPDEERQRRKTLATVITAGGILLIGTVTLMMILSEIGVDLGPLLATAGVAGLAIGFGAQTLVKDFIGGFFILIEDQYSIGDVVAVAAVDGVVEEVNLRTTILRDLRGVVHVVPNGEIRVVSNRTKEWSRAVLELGVGYREDPDRVIAILQDVARTPSSGPSCWRSRRSPGSSGSTNRRSSSG